MTAAAVELAARLVSSLPAHLMRMTRRMESFDEVTNGDLHLSA